MFRRKPVPSSRLREIQTLLYHFISSDVPQRMSLDAHLSSCPSDERISDHASPEPSREDQSRITSGSKSTSSHQALTKKRLIHIRCTGVSEAVLMLCFSSAGSTFLSVWRSCLGLDRKIGYLLILLGVCAVIAPLSLHLI